MSHWSEYVVLCLAAAGGGAVNSVAGGGTLLTFPALFAVLGPSAEGAVMANATSTVALVPGSVAAMWGYRRELADMQQWAWRLALPSLMGGGIGAWLVVKLPAPTFAFLVPWLILLASLLFIAQPAISRWTGIGQPHQQPSAVLLVGIVAFQLLVGIYGGYFGAGIGILMLSSLALMGLADIHRMNAVKTLLAALINGVAVAVFVSQGRVHWPMALAMAAAAVLGGYWGAQVARRMNRNHVRRGVIAMGLGLSAYYFFQQWSA